MRKNIKEVKNIIASNKAILKDGYKIKSIGVFGSYAKDQNTKKSDIDILVEFSESPGLFKFMEIEEFLSRILKTKVDLVTKNALKPAIKDQILQEVVYV